MVNGFDAQRLDPIAVTQGLEAANKRLQNKRDQDAALAQLITGKQMDADAAKAAADRAAGDAGAKQKAINDANLGTFSDPRLQNNLQQGGSAQVGDIHAGADPTARLAGKQQGGDEAARRQATQLYTQGLAKVQPVIQAASEGLDLSNDPKNPGSLGTARTLMLKSMGMNRYNENEAKAVLPPSVHGYVANIFNAAGGDESPLNDVQRSAVNQFFKTQLENAGAQHDTLKQNALGAYGRSLYATPQGQQALQSLGSPIDSVLTKARGRYKDLPQTQGPNLTSAPQPGMLDKLKGFLTGGSSPAPAPQAAPQPQKQMTFEEFKAARAAGKL